MIYEGVRFCVMCKNFEMEEGHVYSTLTGDPASVGCALGHWKMYHIEADMEFRNKQKTAQTCKDYDDSDVKK